MDLAKKPSDLSLLTEGRRSVRKTAPAGALNSDRDLDRIT
jgi:hypothetical protein